MVIATPSWITLTRSKWIILNKNSEIPGIECPLSRVKEQMSAQSYHSHALVAYLYEWLDRPESLVCRIFKLMMKKTAHLPECLAAFTLHLVECVKQCWCIGFLLQTLNLIQCLLTYFFKFFLRSVSGRLIFVECMQFLLEVLMK